MRKNALANRERILTAAETVFGASGELGSTEDVADRAGVGIATVFRHFPTKGALIEATLVRQFDRLGERAAKVLTPRSLPEIGRRFGGRDHTTVIDRLGEQAARFAADLDPEAAVRELIGALIEGSSTKLTLISLVGEDGQYPAAVEEATGRVQEVIGEVLGRARDAGVVAADVTVEEFFVLVRGLGQAAAMMPAAAMTVDRAVELVVRGLAPAQARSDRDGAQR